MEPHILFEGTSEKKEISTLLDSAPNVLEVAIIHHNLQKFRSHLYLMMDIRKEASLSLSPAESAMAKGDLGATGAGHLILAISLTIPHYPTTKIIQLHT